MNNIPKINLGIAAVSRDCFPQDLSNDRKARVIEECRAKNVKITGIETIVENEKDTLKALEEIRRKNINALVIFLGNFGPEGPTTILAQKFNGPVMIVAAAEETKENLIEGRGDAYCGLLNTSYNLRLRHLRPYIPEYPVGTASEVADMIREFLPVARVILGLKKIKDILFWPPASRFRRMQCSH